MTCLEACPETITSTSRTTSALALCRKSRERLIIALRNLSSLSNREAVFLTFNVRGCCILQKRKSEPPDSGAGRPKAGLRDKNMMLRCGPSKRPFAAGALTQLQRFRISPCTAGKLTSPRIRFFRSCNDSKILSNFLDALFIRLDIQDKGCNMFSNIDRNHLAQSGTQNTPVVFESKPMGTSK